MRLFIPVAAATLILTACGDSGQSENAQNADAGLTAESIVANDVTAIDAVTADAANMAADVDIDFTNDMLDPGGNRASRSERAPASTRRTAPPDRSEAPEPADQPVANASSNAADPNP